MANPEDVLREGDLIVAEVEEELSGSESNLIVSYRGQLLRVQNSSGKRLRRGDRLELLVVGKNPFELRLLSDIPKRLSRLV